jgi:hypothetical protein
MRSLFVVLISLAALSVLGCARLNIRRTLYNDAGRKVGRVIVNHPAATSQSVARLLESARLLERTKQDGDAERRMSKIAEQSVDKGRPTTVATRGGSVQSGYIGYGPYGYDPYSYGGYDPTMFYPGVDPNMVRIEAMWRRGQIPGGLPPLGEPIVPYSQPGVPGSEADPGVQKVIRDLQTDVDELIRAHTSKRDK